MGKKRTGFALLSAEQRKSVARRGGAAAHKVGKAYRFTKETAAAAGRLGGLATASIPGQMSAISRLNRS